MRQIKEVVHALLWCAVLAGVLVGNPGCARTKMRGESGAPRAVVVTMGEPRDETQGDTVGLHVTAEALEQMIPMLEEEVGGDGTGIVVLRVNSGGGDPEEVQRISDVLDEKYKKRFRTVGWIDLAIGAAARSTLCLEELYFAPRGSFGEGNDWRGNSVIFRSRDLEKQLLMMERISARGGYDPQIARSMMIEQPLSATRLPDGMVKFFPDERQGEFVVNREHSRLCLNADSALKIGLSRGTADTLDALARAMGCPDVKWVGEAVPGFSIPVCKAEQWNRAYRTQVSQRVKQLSDLVASHDRNMRSAAGEVSSEGRAKLVGSARAEMEKINAMVRAHPNLIRWVLNLSDEQEYRNWVGDQEKAARGMMR